MALVFGANAGMFRINNFSLTGNKAFQDADVFVANFFDVLRTKNTLTHADYV